jgi:lambda repressor-like predicted transcriptional regulator
MTEANAKAKIIADMVAELKAAGWSENAIAREVDYADHALRANLATRDDAAWNYGFI